MNTLAIPAPTLTGEPAGASPEIEKPLAIKLPALHFADGTSLGDADVTKIGAFIYRRRAGVDELWDEQAQVCMAAPGELDALASKQPLPLQFKSGEPEPWTGTLVALGLKDKSGAPRFGKQVGGLPRYFVRVFAQANKEGVVHRGLGQPSAEVAFESAIDNQRFAVELDPSEARDATRVRLALKNSNRALAGWLEVRASGGQEVEIVKCDAGGNAQSSLLLADDGSIRLRPAAGREIVLEGTLRAERVRYLNAAGVLTEL
jgi:hypothetical protein